VPKCFEEAQDISWKDHLAMQAVFAEQVDSSVSKTINLPQEATVEDIMGAYIGAFDMNIKSTAVYRDGSKTQILETLRNFSTNTGVRPQTVVTLPAPKRPDELECDINAVSVKGERWKVLVGLLHGRPYEVFCFPESQIEISASRNRGILQRNGHGKYNLVIGKGEDTWTIKNVAQHLLTDEHRMITRLLSTSLRHGAPLNAIVSQLSKCDGEVTAFSKAILRVLRKYVTDEEYLEVSSCRACQSSNLIMESGCLKCADCGYSGCD
jgi:ribonucleoside-diphosphate reductase alpha chain